MRPGVPAGWCGRLYLPAGTCGEARVGGALSCLSRWLVCPADPTPWRCCVASCQRGAGPVPVRRRRSGTVAPAAPVSARERTHPRWRQACSEGMWKHASSSSLVMVDTRRPCSRQGGVHGMRDERAARRPLPGRRRKRCREQGYPSARHPARSALPRAAAVLLRSGRPIAGLGEEPLAAFSGRPLPLLPGLLWRAARLAQGTA